LKQKVVDEGKEASGILIVSGSKLKQGDGLEIPLLRVFAFPPNLFDPLDGCKEESEQQQQATNNHFEEVSWSMISDDRFDKPLETKEGTVLIK